MSVEPLVFADCPDDGGTMVERYTSYGSDSATIAVRCEDCGSEVTASFEGEERETLGLTGILERDTEVENVRISDTRKERCLNCYGDGEIIGCIDDLCHAQGRCMHNGNDICPECNGRGFLIHEATDDSGGDAAA